MPKPKQVCTEPLWAGQYNRLIEDGKKPSEIDTGYSLLRVKPGADAAESPMDFVRIGSSDGKIECAEIAETTVAEAERYRDFLETLTGRPVPWLAPKTPSPEEELWLKKMDAAIDIIQKEIASRCANPDDDEYRIKLFAGLFIFAFLPSGKYWEQFKTRKPESTRKIMGILWSNGLVQFAGHVLQNGGLGLGFFEKDMEEEGAGLEPLLKQKGACTEKNKIFYMLARRAGLKPVFVHMTASDFMGHWRNQFGNKLPMLLSTDEMMTGHITTALPLKDGRRFFVEFNLNKQPWSDFSYGPFAHDLSLREFYQADLNNLAIDKLIKNSAEDVSTWVNGGLALQTSALVYLLYSHGAQTALNAGQMDLFSQNALAVLLANPLFPPPMSWLMAATDAELHAAFEKHLEKNAERDPAAAFFLALSHGNENRIDMAEKWAQKAVDQGYKDFRLFNIIGKAKLEEEDWEGARKNMEASLQLNPVQSDTQFFLSQAYEKQGELPKAHEALWKTLQTSSMDTPKHFQALSLLADSAAALGKSKQAKGYMEMALNHSRPFFSAEIYLALYKAAKITGDLPRLIPKMERFHQELPRNLLGKASLLHLHWHTGRKEEALDLLSFLKTDIENVTQGLADIDFEESDPEAIAQLDQIISILDDEILQIERPLFVRFYEALGGYYAMAGKTAAGEKTREKIRSLHSS